MSSTRFFNVKTHFTENMASLLMSVIFADFAKESRCFMREKHAVQSVPETADIAEIGMSHTVTSRELVRQGPTQNLREFPKTPLQQENFSLLQQAVQLRHSCGGLFHRVAAQPSVLPLSATGGGRYSVP